MVRARHCTTVPSRGQVTAPHFPKYRSLRFKQGFNIVSQTMGDARDSKLILDAARESGTSTPEACAAVSEARAPLESVDVQRVSNQPRIAGMVSSAILALNEPGGSSIQAIKRYMVENYNIDTKKKEIKRYVISAVDAGVLHRTEGAGAAGFFQVRRFNPPKQKPEAAKKKAVAELKPEAVTKNAVAEKTTPAAKTPAAANKKLGKAIIKKQTAAGRKLAEVVKKQMAADKELADAAKKKAAAEKNLAEAVKKKDVAERKLAGAVKKLAAAEKKRAGAMKKLAAAQKAAIGVVSEKNVNKESAADLPNAKTATSQ